MLSDNDYQKLTAGKNMLKDEFINYGELNVIITFSKDKIPLKYECLFVNKQSHYISEILYLVFRKAFEEKYKVSENVIQNNNNIEQKLVTFKMK